MQSVQSPQVAEAGRPDSGFAALDSEVRDAALISAEERVLLLEAAIRAAKGCLALAAVAGPATVGRDALYILEVVVPERQPMHKVPVRVRQRQGAF